MERERLKRSKEEKDTLARSTKNSKIVIALMRRMRMERGAKWGATRRS